MVDDYEVARERWGFEIPADYRRCWEAGLLNRDVCQGLCLSALRWLSPNEIATLDWPAWKISKLMPFAATFAGDHYCWFFESPGRVWVADCPRDSDFASGYAPTFEGFVYRAILEEFVNTRLGKIFELSDADLQALLIAIAERAARILPQEWSAVLNNFARRPLRSRMLRAVIIQSTASAVEVERVVKRDLGFAMLDREFRQHDL